MNTSPAIIRLELSLPPQWEAAAADVPDASPQPGLGAAIALARASFAHGGRTPDLMAGIVSAVDADGVPTVLIASVACWVYTSASLPELPEHSWQPRVVRGVLVAPDAPVDFLVLTCRVDSADGLTTALLHFSSPNLPLTDELLLAFREIAATARLVPVVEDL